MRVSITASVETVCPNDGLPDLNEITATWVNVGGLVPAEKVHAAAADFAGRTIFAEALAAGMFERLLPDALTVEQMTRHRVRVELP